MSLDIGQFINQYYISPVVNYGEGYNTVNTVTYAIILGISLFAILKLMDILKIKLDERFVIATAPFIIMGASLRVVEDVGMLPSPLGYLFITPFVYVLAFAVTAAALLTCRAMESRSETGDKASRPFLRSGLAAVATIWALLSLVVVAIALVISLTIGGSYTGTGYWTDALSIIATVGVLMLASTVVSLAACVIFERRGMAGDYSKPYFWTGVAAVVVVLVMLSTQHFSSAWWALIVVALLASAWTGGIYLIAKNFKIFVPAVNVVLSIVNKFFVPAFNLFITILGLIYRRFKLIPKLRGNYVATSSSLSFLTNRLNIAILAAHMFDASSTFTAIDIVTGYSEKHVVPVFFIGYFHTAAVMYVLKLAVFIPVIYLIEKYFKDDPQLYYGIKFVLLVLGFGPGIRNTLEMTFLQV